MIVETASYIYSNEYEQSSTQHYVEMTTESQKLTSKSVVK